ncbi:hypothetical protein GLOTRDRAFT_118975 [Gloeophyllum trabeum ATCC 11539]|uniref:Nucleolar 27S pre-rRNA processing Urb2/Npa2 C-terminal domain-containing protein n=1 Tax=Gloeophyllum trabeum (strain ATCC 11539 / FP-39264 / Madison 617) TaxID=670483 RepID=S7QMZ6_GLOTA|nr:uncharacterized protein GLOTRDRAFT_118975 [Gloeophyllum trabeum ATCC 11539]EPQ60931.1 hypothetical protein GLOTRDRAFT_118975 [Gloeophyllum trabeum ATCC 11539]
MAWLQSAQGFVRALKAPIDPPQGGEPYKIEIARTVWDTSDLYIPKKAQIISEWLLTKLLKDRGREPCLNPVVDARFWQLLSETMSCNTGQSASQQANAKTQLLPLLNRTPLAPIVTSLFTLLDLPDQERPELLRHVRNCFDVLWPLAAPKFTAEALLECWAALVALVVKKDHILEKDGNLIRIGLVVCESYRNSMNNSSSKKKLYQTFVKSHMPQWIKCAVCLDSAAPISRLLKAVYAAGVDTLFNLDILRHFATNTEMSSDALFRALMGLVKPSLEAVTAAVPDLFLSYSQAIKKYRSAIFSSGSSSQTNLTLLEQVQASALRFFVSCEGILRASPEDFPAVWKARVRLLEVIDQEDLSGPAQTFRSNALKDEEVDLIQNKITQDAVAILVGNSGTAHSEAIALKIILAVQCLIVLVKIDGDILSPSLSRLLQALMLLPQGPEVRGQNQGTSDLVAEIDTLLGLILSHHSKKRTLPSYLDTLLFSTYGLAHTRAVMLDTPQGSVSIPPEYTAIHQSRIMSQYHLGQVSKGCHAYLTPSQIEEAVECIQGMLKNGFDAFCRAVTLAEETTDQEGDKRKKRKSSSRRAAGEVGPCPVGESIELATIRITLVTKLAGAILPSLPLQSLATDSRQAVVLQIHAGVVQDVILPAVRAFTSVGREVSNEGSPKKRKNRESAKHGLEWAMQTVAAAALRLHYAITCAKQLSSGMTFLGNHSAEAEAEMKQALLKALRKYAEPEVACHAPELIPELVRTLLKFGQFSEEPEALLGTILQYLENQLKSTASWNGAAAELDSQDARHSGAVALLYTCVDRWLEVFERSASVPQIARLIGVFVNLALRGPPENYQDRIDAHDILYIMLRGAGFWEMPKFRAALFLHIDEITSPYDSFNLSDLLSRFRDKGMPSQDINRDALLQVLGIYRLLLQMPQEYVPRLARGDIMKRGAILDIIATMNWLEGDIGLGPSRAYMAIGILSIRAFMVRTSKYQGLIDHDALAEMAEYLLRTGYTSSAGGSSSSEDGKLTYQSVTIDLIRMYSSTMLKRAQKGDDAPLLRFLSSSSLVSPFAEGQERENHIAQQSLLCMIDDLASDFLVDEFSPRIQASLRSLHQSLESTVARYLSTWTAKGASLAEGRMYLDAWRRALRLGSWLKSDAAGSSLGQNLIAKVSPSLCKVNGKEIAHLSLVCGSVIHVMHEEYRSIPDIDRLSQAEVATAFYLMAATALDHVIVDEPMSKFCKTLSGSDFTSTLDLISEFVTARTSSPRDLECLIHLSTLFLRDSPEGTLKVTQNFVTRCLYAFTNHAIFYTGPQTLRLAVLAFISRHLSERPAAARGEDVNSIWALMSQFLSGSDRHDEETSEAIFQQLVNILSALVRLRRDLLLPTLPHLGFVMRQLIRATRRIRPHLGGKQSKLVADSLPMWINVAQPLSTDASKVLGRLLTSLGAKTVVRTHGNPPETHKAESLMKPFSKHAAYVLQAYIETMNDPLCLMPLEVRKELQPGLFTLCDMLSDYTRDAMMVSALDAGGKATMKVLWKEYEKQKYTGKG